MLVPRTVHLAVSVCRRHQRIFIGSIFTPWALPVAILPLTITLIGWFWPKDERADSSMARARERSEAA
jgi:hypothetical protein